MCYTLYMCTCVYCFQDQEGGYRWEGKKERERDGSKSEGWVREREVKRETGLNEVLTFFTATVYNAVNYSP